MSEQKQEQNQQQPGTVNITAEMLEKLQKELNRPIDEVRALASALSGPDAERNQKTLYMLFSFFNEANQKAAEQGKELTAAEQTKLFQKIKKDFETADFRNRKPVDVEKVDLPLDKLNNTVWGALALKKGQGNQNAVFGFGKHNSGQVLKTFYTVNFDEIDKVTHLELSKQLEPFDKRVYMIVSALFNAGNEVVTVTQVCAELFGSNKPSKRQFDRVNKSLMKMERTRIDVDNKEESEIYRYPHFKYSGYLLPVERVEAITKGQVSEGALHLFREPPLLMFARGRKQLTSVPKNLIQSPLSKTDELIQIEDYLIERIAQAKREKKPGEKAKLLLETIYTNTNSKKSKSDHQKRVLEKIRALLNHYVECEYIRNFTIDESQGFILLSV